MTARNLTQLTSTSDKPSEELPSPESPKYPHTSPSEYSFRKRSAHAHHGIFFLSSPVTVEGIVSNAGLNCEVNYGDVFCLSGVMGLIIIAPHFTQEFGREPPPPHCLRYLSRNAPTAFLAEYPFRVDTNCVGLCC